jgi:hypothetical protein
MIAFLCFLLVKSPSDVPSEAPSGAVDAPSDAPSEAVDAHGISAGRQMSEEAAFGQSPPFSLPASLRPESYEQGENIESWWAFSEGSCKDVARDLLLQLRESEMKLVEAGYLDLFGEAWGCTLEDGGEASITIILMPKEPFRQRSTSNPLRMTLIRTPVPQQGILLQEAGEER